MLHYVTHYIYIYILYGKNGNRSIYHIYHFYHIGILYRIFSLTVVLSTHKEEDKYMSKYSYGFRFINDGEARPPKKRLDTQTKMFQAHMMKPRRKKKKA